MGVREVSPAGIHIPMTRVDDGNSVTLTGCSGEPVLISMFLLSDPQDYCCTKEKEKCNFGGQRKKRSYIFEPNTNEQEVA
ncbi:hypothetical protein Hdeb2414_s0585g00919941 [Helianthus debilis subsp. tardiflorus]